MEIEEKEVQQKNKAKKLKQNIEQDAKKKFSDQNVNKDVNLNKHFKIIMPLIQDQQIANKQKKSKKKQIKSSNMATLFDEEHEQFLEMKSFLHKEILKMVSLEMEKLVDSKQKKIINALLNMLIQIVFKDEQKILTIDKHIYTDQIDDIVPDHQNLLKLLFLHVESDFHEKLADFIDKLRKGIKGLNATYNKNKNKKSIQQQQQSNQKISFKLLTSSETKSDSDLVCNILQQIEGKIAKKKGGSYFFAIDCICNLKRAPLTSLVKYLDEECLNNREMNPNQALKIFFLLPVSQEDLHSVAQITCFSTNVTLHRFIFYQAKHLFCRLLINLMENPRFLPILHPRICQSLLQAFSHYNLSFFECVRRIEAICQIFLNGLTFEKKNILESITYILHSTKSQNNSIIPTQSSHRKDQYKSTLAVEIRDERERFAQAVKLLHLLYKTQLDKDRTTRAAHEVLQMLTQDKLNFQLPSSLVLYFSSSDSSYDNENKINNGNGNLQLQQIDRIQNVADGIATIISTVPLKDHLMIIDGLKTLKDKTYQQITQKIKKDRVQRILQKDILLQQTNDSMCREMQTSLIKLVSSFVQFQVREQIQKFVSAMPAHPMHQHFGVGDYAAFCRLLKPDIMGEIYRSLQYDDINAKNIQLQQTNKPTKQNQLNKHVPHFRSETALVWQMIQDYGRQFDVRVLFCNFFSSEQNEELTETNCKSTTVAKFVNAIQELKILGFVSETLNTKHILDKNVFAKTMFNDFRIRK